MRAYYYDDAPGDPRAAHDSGAPVPASHLAQLGVLHREFPDTAARADLDALAAQRSYKNRDEIKVSPEAMGDAYEAKIRTFFHEHMHEDEEIRYVLGGAGYFDVRESGDSRWIRVRLQQGDLLVLPAGIYHRFTTDEANYIHAMRLFKDEPKWTPLNRDEQTDANEFRKEYVAARQRGFAEV